MDQNSHKLPLKVLNSLRLRKRVAAEVPSADAEWRSWIMIVPVTETGSAHKLERSFDGDQYRIVHYQARKSAIDRLWDDDLNDGEGSVQIVAVVNEENLVPAVSRWVKDYNDLRDPGNVPEASLIYGRICAFFELAYK